MLAENCYHIVGHLTEHFLSERRLTNPVSNKDADTLHKLTMTINKLKNRSTLNESMEMFGYFLEMLRSKNAKLAEEVMPYIDEHMSSRAGIYAHHVQPDSFTHMGRLPWPDAVDTEKLIDNREAFFNDPDTIDSYEKAGIPFPSEEEISSLPGRQDPPPAQYTLQQRNAENAEKARAFAESCENREYSHPQHTSHNEPQATEPETNEEPVPTEDATKPAFNYDEVIQLIDEGFAYLAQYSKNPETQSPPKPETQTE